jgi:hypothetical protein
MARYAEGTTVEVHVSRGEISGILAKHGVVVQAWGTTPEGDHLQFELAGRVFRLEIRKPTMAEVRQAYSHLYSRQVDWEKKLAQEWRRRWRATVLLLKAKLEFADGEASTIEQELMPYMLLKDGTTLGAAIAGDKVPLLAATAGK